MNWYLRGKLLFLLGWGCIFGLIYLTEDVFHFGIADWFESNFGDKGILIYLLAVALVVGVALHQVKLFLERKR
jgi:hypothetical protein